MLEPALAAAHQDVFFEAGSDRGGEGRVGRAGVDGVPAGHHPSLYHAPVHSRYYKRRMLRRTVLRYVRATRPCSLLI
jgi:hypothetical protein